MNPARIAARSAAMVGGWFWLPCPLCGNEFGGQEWREIGGHSSSIPWPSPENNDPDGTYNGRGICPDCTAAGKGCLVQAERGSFRVGHDCDALGVDERLGQLQVETLRLRTENTQLWEALESERKERAGRGWWPGWGQWKRARQ